uniref:Uncharacterized protein n=1 Tax=Helianthus annuus TaxID=4232 RepID=A0A251VMS4_HELAN
MFLRSINFTDTPGRDGGHMMMAVGGGGGWCLQRKTTLLNVQLLNTVAILSDR